VDALTAGFIVGLIGATALVVVAVVTARGRIGRLPPLAAKESSKPSQVELPEQARHFRVLGWILVLLLYLGAIFCLLQGAGDLRIFFHWDQWQAVFGSQVDARSEIALYSRFWAALGVVLIVIGLWAQWRLRRRAM
jgi:multisubunit Na+/H+ antiporter MnhB subunit